MLWTLSWGHTQTCLFGTCASLSLELHVSLSFMISHSLGQSLNQHKLRVNQTGRGIAQNISLASYFLANQRRLSTFHTNSFQSFFFLISKEIYFHLPLNSFLNYWSQVVEYIQVEYAKWVLYSLLFKWLLLSLDTGALLLNMLLSSSSKGCWARWTNQWMKGNYILCSTSNYF